MNGGGAGQVHQVVAQLEDASQEAVRLFEVGDYEAAVSVFSAINRVTVGNPSILYSLGLSLWRLQRFDEAISIFSEGVVRFPDRGDFVSALVMGYRELGDFTSARSLCRDALRRNPGSSEVQEVLSSLESLVDGSSISSPRKSLSGRVLFVVEPESIHAVRWIEQLRDSGLDIHMTTSIAETARIHPGFTCGTFHLEKEHSHSHGVAVDVNPLMQPGNEVEALMSLIDKLQPDIIHSLGLYVNHDNRNLHVAKALEQLDRKKRYTWLYSSWGADLDFYGKERAKKEEMEQSLRRVDYMIAECFRDARLAQEFGFKGELLDFLPAFGGVEWNAEEVTRPSERKSIIIKARDEVDGDPIGSARSIIWAFLASTEELEGYTIKLLSAGPQVQAFAENLRDITDLSIEVLGHLPAHSDVLREIASARIMIAATTNDGLPSFLVESMSLGAFPIQSRLESVSEWITDGANGLLIDPKSPRDIQRSLRRALYDDALVDDAARYNRSLVQSEFSYDRVQKRAIGIYQRLIKGMPGG